MSISPVLTSVYNWIQMGAVTILSLAVGAIILRIYVRTTAGARVMAHIFALQIVVIGVCVGIDSLLNSRYPIIFGIVATGLLTVYGQMLHFMSLRLDGSLHYADVRTSIALSMTVMYLTLVGYGAFLSETEHMSPLGTTLINSFTSLVAMVIAFYFGATAYVEAKRATAGGTPDQVSTPDRNQFSPVTPVLANSTTQGQPAPQSVSQKVA